MSAAFNPHVAISSPFGTADLPTLCVWKNRLHKLNGEPEENVETFMEDHLARKGVKTFAAYRDEELGGYFESVPGEISFPADSSSASVTKVEMVFKREFFKRKPENGNGIGVGGHDTTRPALNLVLRDLFEEYELVFFPLNKNNRPIQSLVLSVGAANVGVVDDDLMLYLLSRPEWERINAAFIAEYEVAYPIYSTVDDEETMEQAQ